MKYTCNDIFMIRTPSLPVNVFSDFMNFQGDHIEDFITQNELNNFFDKSILIATRGLYEAKEKESQHRKKKMKAKELSLLKFLIRSSTRPTPYGFFAGVALGAFSNEVTSDLIADEKKAMIECRVDHAWLFHFIYELENNPNVYTQLKLRFNNNCYVSGDRLKNPHYSNHGFVPPSKSSITIDRNHIRNTPLITYIRQEAKTFIYFNELKTKIQNKYPDVPEEKIVSTINMLMENEILLTNLRAPSNCVNGLEYILKVLDSVEGIDKQKEDLQKVNALLNEINNERELEKIDAATIQEIYALQEGLLANSNEKDLLALNKGNVLTQNKLPQELKATIENFVEAFTYLQVDVPSNLTKFKKQFQEEYGSQIEVPLCTIIDPNDFNGLAYLENVQTDRDEKDKKMKQIIDEKILYCLQTQGEEVKLYKNDFTSLGAVNESKLPASFDINFFVTKKDHTYNLTVAPAGGSASAGDMFNRFSNVLDDTLFDQYRENNKRGKNVDPDVITVEIREGSTKGRLGNINNHSSEQPYFIALATNDDHSQATELTLDDLWIGNQNERFYIKSKSQGKQCNIVHDCMINRNILSNVTKFLLDVSSDQETSLIGRKNNLFHNYYIYLPRILLEGVVVQPKSWYLPEHLFELKTLQSFTESLQTLRKEYKIDDIVYLTEFDNRLVLNLNMEYSYEILYKHIRKNKDIKLNELEQNMLAGNICLDTSGKSYVSEISCSLTLSANKKSIVSDHQLEYALQNENRPLLLLQDGWVYVKLYDLDDRENEVLQYISLFLQNIGNPKIFYLRYVDDSGKHLRVRFKYADENTAQKQVTAIQKMLLRFRENKLINHVQFDTYLRENNRYGGSQLIELAEEVFFADSLFVINLLNDFNFEETADLEQAYLLGICTILTAFFDNLDDMFYQANLTPLQDENKQAFRGKKQAYIKKVEQLVSSDYSGLSAQTISLIAAREEAIKKYDAAIEKTASLSHAREDIVRSVVHMCCNRLRGGWNLEGKHLNIIRESLSNIIEKNKRVPK